MRRFFQIGLAVQLTLVVLGALGAYTGTLPGFVQAVPHLDFAIHALFIGGVAFFLDGVLAHRPLWRGHGSLAGALVLAAAGVEEWAQRFSPRRSSSLSDFVADTIGVIFFVWLARRLAQSDAPRPLKRLGAGGVWGVSPPS